MISYLPRVFKSIFFSSMYEVDMDSNQFFQALLRNDETNVMTTHEEFLLMMYKRAMIHEVNNFKKESELKRNNRKRINERVDSEDRTNTQYSKNRVCTSDSTNNENSQ